MWKPVLGYEDCYQVSDDGRVKRVATYGESPHPRQNILAKRLKRGGYVTYHLSKGVVKKDPPAHRLVWEAFNGLIPEGLEMNHKNGDKTDNRLVNLEAITRSENMKHKFRVLRCPAPNNPNYGTTNGSNKLSEAEVLEVIAMCRRGIPQKHIAKQFGVTQTLVSMISRGKLWNHLTKVI